MFCDTTKSPTNYLKTHWIFLFFCLLYSLYQGHIVIYIICGSPFILIFFSLPLLPYFLLIPFYPYFLLYTPSSLFLPMFLCILILYPYPFCVVLLTSCAPIILRFSKCYDCGQCSILSTLCIFFICVFKLLVLPFFCMFLPQLYVNLVCFCNFSCAEC